MGDGARMNRLLLIACTLAAITCTACSSPDTATPSVAHPAFADPERVCRALEGDGLSPALNPVWKQVAGQEIYSCVANEMEVAPGSPGELLPNVIEYYAQSEGERHVDQFRLTASIFNEQNAAPAVAKLGELAQTLFERLELPMPEGLLNAIEAGQSESFPVEYGVVALERESYNRGYGLQVQVDHKLSRAEESTP